jgi:hypothetical protein
VSDVEAIKLLIETYQDALLALSHHLNRTNGLAYLVLVTMWLRAFGCETPVTFQTDWGEEFGGDNPERVRQLSEQFLAPLDAHSPLATPWGARDTMAEWSAAMASHR